MTPVALINAARQDGLTFKIIAPEGLKVLGPPEAIKRWAPLLKTVKPAIRDILLYDERQRIMRHMAEWSERAAFMTTVSVSGEQAELMAWHDLNLDAAFFGLHRLN